MNWFIGIWIAWIAWMVWCAVAGFIVITGARVRLEFKPQDLWVGVFWKTTATSLGWGWRTDVWICLIPMLPIHMSLRGINR